MKELSATIEISLFALLDEVSELLENIDKLEEPEQRTLNFHKIQDNIESFVDNFFLQLFKNGFGLDLDGINVETLSKIEEHFSGHSEKETPINIIDSFGDVADMLEDIEDAVYMDPPIEGDLYDAYLNFLPVLFDDFKKDEAALQPRINNYGAIKVRMEGILVKMNKLKGQTQLA